MSTHQLNALTVIASLRERLVAFALESHFARDPKLQAEIGRLWAGPGETGGLVGDPWVEAAFPPLNADATPQSLAEAGRLHPHLVDHLHARGVFPRDRPLYRHQHDALIAADASREATERPAVLVMAGTGAGKTESFLLPTLNNLWAEPAGEAQGISCLILYPMNALVNDQVDRLYSWLRGQEAVTLFHFTSETPEDHSRADQQGVPTWDTCRFRTRRQARGREDAAGRPTPPANAIARPQS